AVALWLPPGRRMGFWPVLRSGLAIVRSAMALPADDRRRMMPMFRQLDQKSKQHVPEPHWYLMALGTEPHRQGQGLGSALVRVATQRADQAATRTYLETETADNVRYYERHGFEVVEEVTTVGLGVPVWLMIRPPNPDG
ncbi:MAG: GNAT family N-acetyltransferase, partial [Ilumatobacter sp.]|uniref:GNAT family N-acetyltransferase n=1 Tax=Ilumatobacter sp. TaxID=1967498 RepID=UPI00261EBB08